jgi:hypothetical protein
MSQANAILDAGLKTSEGALASLRDYLSQGPVVVVFLRHFG